MFRSKENSTKYSSWSWEADIIHRKHGKNFGSRYGVTLLEYLSVYLHSTSSVLPDTRYVGDMCDGYIIRHVTTVVMGLVVVV